MYLVPSSITLRPRLVLLFDLSQAKRPTSLRTRQLRPLLTPCEALWPAMMLSSKLSRASSVRPQQPLFRPRFASQSFNRSIRSPRYRATDTNLSKTPERKDSSVDTHPGRGFFEGLFAATFIAFVTALFVSPKQTQPNIIIISDRQITQVTPGQDVVLGPEEKSRQRDREAARVCHPDYPQSQDEEWRRGSNGHPAHSRRTVPTQLPAELLHHK